MSVASVQAGLPGTITGFEKAFRTTMVLTAAVALLSISVALASPAYLVVTLLACYLSWQHTEVRQRQLLPRRAVVPLMILAVICGAMLWLLSVTRLMPAIAHILIWLQLIKLFQHKRIRDYWQLLILSTLGISAAFMISVHFSLAVFIILYAVSLFWALILLHLRCEMAKAQPVQPAAAAVSSALPYPGQAPKLMTPRLLVVINLIIAGSIVFDLAFFLFCPRLNKALFGHGPFAFRGSRTGFSPGVTLGEPGEIVTSEDPVMHVTVTDSREPGKPIQGDFYWRGVALCYYNGKDWSRRHPNPTPDEKTLWRRSVFSASKSQDLRRARRKFGRLLKHDVLREPIDSRFLFCPSSWVDITSTTIGDLYKHYIDGATSFVRRPKRAVRYSIHSVPPNLLPKSLQKPSDKYSPHIIRNFLQLPGNKISSRVVALAKEIVPDDLKRNSLQKADRIANYLRRTYTYTLKLSANPEVEPVEDFLFNQRAGHCEYFASAMVILLRTLGVPCRLVTGYHGGQYNAIGGWYLVRQSDAHAWVEVYVTKRSWKIYDPSPAREAEQQPTRVGELIDFLATTWFTSVIEYDRHKQLTVYGLVGQTIKSGAAFLAQVVWGLQQMAAAALSRLKSPRFLFSLKGLTTLAWLVALAAALTWLGKGLARRALARVSGKSRGKGPFGIYPSPVKFYRRMLELLARQGFVKAPGDTPMEFARQVHRQGGAGYDALPVITRYYYQVRFGSRVLSPPEAKEVARTLKALSARRNNKPDSR